MNFMFEWQEQYLTSERSERARYCSCHENIKFISSSYRVIFFLLYKHTDDGVFDDFPTTFRRFPKIFQIVPKTRRTFPKSFRKFPKISEDVRRLSKIAEHFRGRPEDVSMKHQRI